MKLCIHVHQLSHVWQVILFNSIAICYYFFAEGKDLKETKCSTSLQCTHFVLSWGGLHIQSCNQKHTQGLTWLFITYAVLIDVMYFLSGFTEGMQSVCKQSPLLNQVTAGVYVCIWELNLKWSWQKLLTNAFTQKFLFGLILQHTLMQMHVLHPVTGRNYSLFLCTDMLL